MDASIAANHRHYVELSAYNNSVYYSELKLLPNATPFPSLRPAFARQPTFIVLVLGVGADGAVHPVFSRAVVARACNTCAEFWHLDDWATPRNILRQPLVGQRRRTLSVTKVTTSPGDDLRHMLFLVGRSRGPCSSGGNRFDWWEARLGDQDSVLHTCHSTLDSDFAATAPPTVKGQFGPRLQHFEMIVVLMNISYPFIIVVARQGRQRCQRVDNLGAESDAKLLSLKGSSQPGIFPIT
jgi:hypothetical protein